jgi:four helix bundle protein
MAETKIQNYRDLTVWKRGIGLVKEVYRVTRSFPDAEKFGLISQMQRCAVSIPSNIAEGQGRGHSGDFCRFLNMALGSAAELDTQIEIACQLGYLSPNDYAKLTTELTEIRKMTYGLINRLKIR